MGKLTVRNRMCPKCGCPPRYAVGVFMVRVNLIRSGEDYDLGDEKRVLRPQGDNYELECGGGHRWKP